MSSADRWSCSRRRWALGLITGVVAGAGAAIAGGLGGLLALCAMVLVAARPPRDAPAGGLATGLGSTWLLVLIRGDLACDVDCVAPDTLPWYAIAAAFLALGILVTARAFRT